MKRRGFASTHGRARGAQRDFRLEIQLAVAQPIGAIMGAVGGYIYSANNGSIRIQIAGVALAVLGVCLTFLCSRRLYLLQNAQETGGAGPPGRAG